jgi:hypothetical protein
MTVKPGLTYYRLAMFKNTMLVNTVGPREEEGIRDW